MSGGTPAADGSVLWINGRPYREVRTLGSGASSTVSEVEMLVPKGLALILDAEFKPVRSGDDFLLRVRPR